MEKPSAQVLAAFGLTNPKLDPAPRGWGGGVMAGPVVLTQVPDRARATWSARIRDNLNPSGIRIARPFRSHDGRVVVNDWRADHYNPGQPQNRPDEIIAASLRLHDALKDEEKPRFLAGSPNEPWSEVDYFTMADRASCADEPLSLLWDYLPIGTSQDGGFRKDIDEGIELYRELAELRTPLTAPEQVVHGDLLFGTLFAPDEAPLIPDIVPYWHSPSWAAGVVVVDALTWAGSDTGLAKRWRHLPEWPQQLLRAFLFRLGLHLVHRHSAPRNFEKLLHTSPVIRSVL